MVTAVESGWVQNEKTKKWFIDKDPNATLDYIFDWTAWLDKVGDSLNSAAPSVEAGSATIASYSIVGKTVVVWVSGGTPGETVTLRCRVTTNNSPPRIDDRTGYIKIKER